MVSVSIRVERQPSRSHEACSRGVNKEGQERPWPAPAVVVFLAAWRPPQRSDYRRRGGSPVGQAARPVFRCEAMSGAIASAKAFPRSCLPPGMTCRTACGSSDARRSPTATGLIGSASPQSSKDGTLIEGRVLVRSSLSSANQRGSEGLASRKAGRQSWAAKSWRSMPPEVTVSTRCVTNSARRLAACSAITPPIDWAMMAVGWSISATTFSTRSSMPATEGSCRVGPKPGHPK
ncbi:MAG: hypothetical protein RI907_1112 [Pseudomonadota bacterium]